MNSFRHDINTLFSRVSKVHEKEFEVLKAWQLLNEAQGAVFQVAKPLRQYPDFNRLSAEQFEALLKESRLMDFQKEELRNLRIGSSIIGKRCFGWSLAKPRVHGLD